MVLMFLTLLQGGPGAPRLRLPRVFSPLPARPLCDDIPTWDPGAQVSSSVPLWLSVSGSVPSNGGALLPDGASPRALGLDHWLVDAFNKTDTQMTTRPHVPARRLLSPKPPREKLQATKTTINRKRIESINYSHRMEYNTAIEKNEPEGI